MKLSVFITSHIQQILDEWDTFARANAPEGSNLSASALRDHSEDILKAIALDIETQQSAGEQKRKSEGAAPGQLDCNSAAAVHGALRQASDFSLLQLSAEFRALRAAVLRLWLPQVGEMSGEAMDAMVRFNEAIDQALAESIVAYAAQAAHTRELFLAVLGHDLRAPLATIALAGDTLAHPALEPRQVPTVAARVTRAARHMREMVDNLLGYTRVELGKGIPIARQPNHIGHLLQAAIEDAGAAYPRTRFTLETSGDLSGAFDGGRLQQVFVNLLVNAAQHGARERAVAVDAQGDGDTVSVRITNHGKALSDESLQAIFKPLVQLPGAEDDSDPRPSTSLGLGLFVARNISESHGGTIAVTSSETAGTTFTVTLPRSGADANEPTA